MWLNISNFFSTLRILISPLIFLSIIQGSFLVSFLLFVLAAISDFLDGYLARALKIQTIIGKYLDPLADKIFFITCFIALYLKELIPIWFVGFIVVREITIIVGTMAIQTFKGIKAEQGPTIWGKLNTAVLMLFMAFIIICSHYSSLSANTSNTLLYISSGLALFSLIHYIILGVKLIKD